MGLHFLMEGANNQEQALYITLGESQERIQQNASSIGMDVKKIHFLDLSPGEKYYKEEQNYGVFFSYEVENSPITQKIIEAVETLRPQRVFLDSMTLLQYLIVEPIKFRRQIISFTEFLNNRGVTFLFSSEPSSAASDEELRFIADGVIQLNSESTVNKIEILKFRGSGFKRGAHTYKLTERGMVVYPRLVPEEYKKTHFKEKISSGIPAIDELLDGGVERGTTTIITGPTGVGKTTLGLQFMKEAAGRGEKSIILTFEESVDSLVLRSESINIPVRAMLEKGTLKIISIEPLKYSIDEFNDLLRHEIEQNEFQIVMIDSIAGFKIAVDLDIQRNLHATTKYLKNMGVSTFLINELENVTGDFKPTEFHFSYLSDNIVFFRYIEFQGELRKAIGVLKKRLSSFERTIREFEISKYGIKVGEPLKNLSGILTGNPKEISFKDNE